MRGRDVTGGTDGRAWLGLARVACRTATRTTERTNARRPTLIQPSPRSPPRRPLHSTAGEEAPRCSAYARERLERRHLAGRAGAGVGVGGRGAAAGGPGPVTRGKVPQIEICVVGGYVRGAKRGAGDNFPLVSHHSLCSNGRTRDSVYVGQLCAGNVDVDLGITENQRRIIRGRERASDQINWKHRQLRRQGKLETRTYRWLDGSLIIPKVASSLPPVIKGGTVLALPMAKPDGVRVQA